MVQTPFRMSSLPGHDQARITTSSCSEKSVPVQQDSWCRSFLSQIRRNSLRLPQCSLLGHRQAYHCIMPLTATSYGRQSVLLSPCRFATHTLDSRPRRLRNTVQRSLGHGSCNHDRTSHSIGAMTGTAPACSRPISRRSFSLRFTSPPCRQSIMPCAVGPAVSFLPRLRPCNLALTGAPPLR